MANSNRAEAFDDDLALSPIEDIEESEELVVLEDEDEEEINEDVNEKLWCTYGEHTFVRIKKAGRKPQVCSNHKLAMKSMNDKIYREKNKNKFLDYIKIYRLKNKEKISSTNKKYQVNNQDKICAWRNNNAEKLKELSRLRYINNLAHERERIRKYKKANPEKYSAYQSKRRALKYNNGFVDKDICWQTLVKRNGPMCYICMQQTDTNSNTLYPTVDHIIPLSKGGSHTWDNVRLACNSCNSSKKGTIYER